MVDLKKFRMFPGVMLLDTLGMTRNLAVSCDLIQRIMRAPDDPMEHLADVKATGMSGAVTSNRDVKTSSRKTWSDGWPAQ